ncbi:DHBP synthase RibB-like alpha/beta domain-containing protein [Gaertneriomyces semiglobifer]|nr:DHBP synthase RibB-like alpha/beta domain-containing protein [Gaertneriomyces semiglobifer]
MSPPNTHYTQCRSVNPASFSFPPTDSTADPLTLLRNPPSPFSLEQPPTTTYSSDVEVIQYGASLLRRGDIVAFPTETVYGLGANALDPDAVAKIFLAKGRPSDNPLIIHVSSLQMLESILPPDFPQIPATYEAVISVSWPGPLTILVPRGPRVPLTVTGGHETVAVRFPSHPIARALIEACGFPLAAPSANTSGRPSPTLASHVIADLEGRVPLVIDGGACGFGVESTVLDGLASPPSVLRPGGVTVEALRSLPGMSQLRVYRKDYVSTELEQAPTTPGMKYRHYTPNAEVVLFEEISEAILREAQHLLATHPNFRVGIMSTSKSATVVDPPSGDIVDIFLGNANEPDVVARELFSGLRTLEARGCNVILVEGIREEREGLAVMNRLRKAASRVVTVS